MPRCTAIKASGEQCRAWAINGTTKCARHGGKSLKGIAHPNFKHGKFVKYIPPRLRERFDESMKDQDLLEMRSSIALTDARVEDLLSRVDTGEAGKLWASAITVYNAMMAAVAGEEERKFQEKIRELGQILNQGSSDFAAWGEVFGLIEQRRRLVESEQKRLIAANSMIPVDQAMVLVSALLDIIKRNVEDQKTLSIISREVGLLMIKEGRQKVDVVDLETDVAVAE